MQVGTTALASFIDSCLIVNFFSATEYGGGGKDLISLLNHTFDFLISAPPKLLSHTNPMFYCLSPLTLPLFVGCSKPQESCTYLTDNFRSRCIQVYNYHRLLSWDKTRGLHVDIFKVPTCCSCRVDGYKDAFPPLTNHYSPANSFYKDDYHPSATSHIRSPYSTINTDFDDEDEDEGSEEDDDEESVGYQYSNGFKR